MYLFSVENIHYVVDTLELENLDENAIVDEEENNAHGFTYLYVLSSC